MLHGNQDLLAALSQLLVEFSEECKKNSQKAAELQAIIAKAEAEANPEKLTEEDLVALKVANAELSETKVAITAYTHITDRLTAIVTKMMGA